jgi:hypothetical protein
MGRVPSLLASPTMFEFYSPVGVMADGEKTFAVGARVTLRGQEACHP